MGNNLVTNLTEHVEHSQPEKGYLIESRVELYLNIKSVECKVAISTIARFIIVY